MLTRSLQSRLIITFVTVMVLGLGGVILLSGLQLTAQSLDRNKQDLELQAQIIANALREPVGLGEHSEGPSGGRSLDALINSYATGIHGRVTLVDLQMNVVFSSDSAVPIHVQEDHAEFIAARNQIIQSDIRWDDWRKEERLFVAVPVITEHGQPLGTVQLSVPTAPIYAEMRQTWFTFLLIGGVGLVLTVAASTVIARQIAVPVRHLTETSEQIAAGRLDERVLPAGPDEIQRLGNSFNRMAERVQEMIAQQRAFVDNAAHELRTPLTSLRLRVEMLQTRGKGDADLERRYLSQMNHELGYLERMVAHLLGLASVEGSVNAAPKLPLDVARTLYAVSDEMSAVVQHAGLDLQTEIPEHLPKVRANPDQLAILARNLIDNAIKYSPRGGTITLSAKAAGDEIQIHVTDTGVGIPPEALPHIFDRFYRVDAAHSRAQGGAGLGLSLVRSIAEAHGGRVEVESRVNQGSRFTVHLPIQDR